MTFRFHPPSGLGATVIQGDPDYLTIEAAGEEPVSSSNPQQLLIESVGWQLPLGAMPYWVKGIPSPDSPYTWQQEHQSQELYCYKVTGRFADRLEPCPLNRRPLFTLQNRHDTGQ